MMVVCILNGLSLNCQNVNGSQLPILLLPYSLLIIQYFKLLYQ